MLKTIVLAFWALVIASFFIEFPANLNSILQGVGAVLLIAHFVEYFIFGEKIKAKGDGTLKSIVNTLVYGIVYINGKT